MSDERIDFYFPKSWEELSDKQLILVYKSLSSNFSEEQICIHLLFRWNNVKVVAQRGDGTYYLSSKSGGKKKLFIVSPNQIAEILPMVRWIVEPPLLPVRVSRFGFHRAIDADFSEVPFEKFVMCDNLFQGYLNSKDEDLLDQMASIMYGYTGRMKPWMRINIFYWAVALKNLLSAKFFEFFQPVSSQQVDSLEKPTAEDSMNAMIRALTKGDITKEKEVLAMDTWRALAELNAQAKEYREFNQKYKK
ncbi:MAG: hypothetical protein J1E16_05710 [Muribaculaceae bacterium]|nr:hypothetical protein [Muribaculaceae bacterium]